MGPGAFRNNLLRTITFPNSLTDLGAGNWVNENQLLDEIRFGTPDYDGPPKWNIDGFNGWDNIGTHNLDDMTQRGIAEVYIGPVVRTIGWQALMGNRLTDVRIPGTVEGIDSSAFANGHIQNIVIEDGVDTINSMAFHLNDIRTITVEGNTSVYLGTFAVGPSTAVNEQPSETNGVTWETWAQRTKDVHEFARMYTASPYLLSFHPDGIRFNTWNWIDPANPGSVSVRTDEFASGGVIMNPATYEIRFVDEETGEEIADPVISGAGETVEGYSLRENPLGDFSLYYKQGDFVTYAPPAVEGYSTPEMTVFRLTRGQNIQTVAYERDAAVTPTPTPTPSPTDDTDIEPESPGGDTDDTSAPPRTSAGGGSAQLEAGGKLLRTGSDSSAAVQLGALLTLLAGAAILGIEMLRRHHTR